MKEKLFGKTLDQLKDVANQLGLPAFTAKQIADWLYKKEITYIYEMSNLSLKARSLLEKGGGCESLLRGRKKNPERRWASWCGVERVARAAIAGSHDEAQALEDIGPP